MSEISDEQKRVLYAHLGWMKTYMSALDKSNYLDMRDYAVRQLEGLDEHLESIFGVGEGVPTGTPEPATVPKS